MSTITIVCYRVEKPDLNLALGGYQVFFDSNEAEEWKASFLGKADRPDDGLRATCDFEIYSDEGPNKEPVESVDALMAEFHSLCSSW